MTRFTKLALAVVLGNAMGVAACDPASDGADEFRNAVPRAETVHMSVPQQSSGQMLLAEVPEATAAEAGKTADLLQLTRAVSFAVNGGGAAVLTLVKLIAIHPPTSMDANHAVWGPWAGGSDPVAWKMTVTRVGQHEYDYLLEGRDRAAANGPFVTVLSGRHAAALDAAGLPVEGYGSGTFLLDWDARNTLPPEPRHPLAKDPEVGKATFTYSRLSAAALVSVDAQFRQVRDEERPSQRVNADYRYRQNPGAGGSMEFLHAPRETNQGGTWAVKSRWNASGAGRADVTGRGGDLPAGTSATVNECWDGGYASRFYLVTVGVPLATYGNQATDCVFPAAEYSTL